jgi:signal transduction histidine kinase
MHQIHRFWLNRNRPKLNFCSRENSYRSTTSDYVTITVKDTGSGIPIEEQATLFERFRQGSHKRSGSGLGLYLSRRIVEAHQGTIQVKSELGKGSEFL